MGEERHDRSFEDAEEKTQTENGGMIDGNGDTRFVAPVCFLEVGVMVGVELCWARGTAGTVLRVNRRNASLTHLSLRPLSSSKVPHNELSRVRPRKVTDHNAEITEFFT
jgi:hypothetical protein